MSFENGKLTLRQDLFQDKKCIHIKLDRDTHAAIRGLSFQRGISMQEMFEEFARSLSSGDKKAVGIIDRFVMQKLNLPKRRLNRYKERRASELNEPDKQSLYDMINNEDNDLFVGDDDEKNS